MKIAPLLSITLFTVVASLNAAPITGIVRLVAGDIATVTIDGDHMPPTGARGEFFFKLAGSEEEVSVATGTALGIDHGNLLVKIEKASGTVEKDHRVRFTSGAAQVTPAGTKAATSPAPSENGNSAGQPSIIGNWVGIYDSSIKYSFTFKEDQTLVWVIDQKAASSDARIESTLHGKYRLDNTTKLGRIDMFELNSPGLVPKDQAFQTPFEFQGDSKLKMDLSTGAHEHPEKGFTDHATIFSRVP